MEIHETRRRRLKQTIDELFGGVTLRCANALDMKPPHLHRWLSRSKSGQNISEQSARRIEQRLGLMDDALDIPPPTSEQVATTIAALVSDGWEVAPCAPGEGKRFEIGPARIDAELKMEKDGFTLWGVFAPWYRVRIHELPQVAALPDLAALNNHPGQSVANADSSLQRARCCADPAYAEIHGDNLLALHDQYLSSPLSQTWPSIIEAEEPHSDGYVRLEHLSPSPHMDAGAGVERPVHVVRHLEVLEAWVREELGSANPDRVKVLTAVGRSMAPTIQDRDLVFVDVGYSHFDAPGIYVIGVAGRLLLKKVMMRADGTVVIRSDNTAEFPDEERYPIDQAAELITVCGKVLAWWTLRKG